VRAVGGVVRPLLALRLSILSQLLSGERHCERRVGADDFQFFPSCCSPFLSLSQPYGFLTLSILSQLLFEDIRLVRTFLVQSDFQFFPSCCGNTRLR